MCRSEGLHFLFCGRRLTEYGSLCYNGSAIGRRQVVPQKTGTVFKGGDNMTTLEVLALLNLLVVVIFGIIDVMMKKK